MAHLLFLHPPLRRLTPTSHTFLRRISTLPFPPLLSLSDLQTPSTTVESVQPRRGSPPARSPTQLAKAWLERFQGCKIQKADITELTFARSSGPGGQNVNKVNTKAVVRCSLGTNWIPVWSKERLREQPSYVKTSDSILISSTRFRTQSENIQDCLDKLHNIVLNAASWGITNEPSEAQRERVKELQKQYAGRVRREKQHRSAVKQSRRRWDD